MVVTYLYYVFKKHAGDLAQLDVSRVMQKIEIGEDTWVLKPIFGNDENEKQATINLNSFKNECIMCFDEPTDVMIYPCRHLSIGYKCAQSLRNSAKCRECPVCRSAVERFVKINI